MIKTTQRRLGKKAPRLDARTYRTDAALTARLPQPPARVDWAKDVTWPVWENDTIGCCTQVSVASAIRTWTGAAQAAVLLSDRDVVGNYGAQSGYVPGQAATDRGAVELDVLTAWVREGYTRPGQPGRDYLTAFGSVDPHDATGVRRAIAFLGGLYIGVQLPRYTLDGAGDWVVREGLDATIAGGHAIWVHGYDADWLYFNSWGQSLRMAWSWFEIFCDEAYALVSRQNWVGIGGCSPLHEDVDALVAEMRAA